MYLSITNEVFLALNTILSLTQQSLLDMLSVFLENYIRFLLFFRTAILGIARLLDAAKLYVRSGRIEAAWTLLVRIDILDQRNWNYSHPYKKV